MASQSVYRRIATHHAAMLFRVLYALSGAAVLGRTYALIYDGNFYSSEGTDLKTLPPPEPRFYFLRSGDRYDLKARKAILDEDVAAASDQRPR
ncbi:hypothetical protein CERZMDRAFT_103092 [Cercospora zeae-maydis SCOH1-5]|uniref:Uncharacterized protein n=1 Tax=Cercospora zeae-maydis SCOH1-5 TaxID=717836 RepID=A0A6A6EZ85_9PEZI|nr:hypothetical protein CERZMDRAFT_103092 [Cercospora zeae-maydis SCOH1-5]